MQYSEHFSTKSTPQSEPIPGKSMVENSAGGYTFQVDKWEMLKRFLILGSEGGTYYIAEKKLTIENAKSAIECIKENGVKVVETIVSISDAGRAYRNDPAIFTLALCCHFGSVETKTQAYKAIPKICRIGTHIFNFCQAVQDLRGWSRGLRRGVASYYTLKTNERLALDLIKYRQRNGWTHRDVLRLSHAVPNDPMMNDAFKFAVGKPLSEGMPPLPLIWAFQEAQRATLAKEWIQLITDYRLPREALPTQALRDPQVWEALLQHMPMTAMIRNLGVMTSSGLLKTNFDESVKKIYSNLNDEIVLKKSKIHPIAILLALKTYTQGHGHKGKLTWEPVQKIIEALNMAFYKTFANVEPTGKNTLLAIDVSGSMDSSTIANTNLSAREAAMAMAMVTANTEPNYQMCAFTQGFVPITFNKTTSLQDLCQATARMPFDETDCAVPMLWATAQKVAVDTFVIYTDSETWAGRIHAKQALDNYRQKMGRDAKCIVVGMTSNGFTIADPTDKGMVDIVGFDSSAPVFINDFSSAKI